MADKAKKELPNIKVVKSFRLKGKGLPVGTVVAKTDFAKKSDWQNLCQMDPAPRAEETDEKVGAPAKKAGGLPGADK